MARAKTVRTSALSLTLKLHGTRATLTAELDGETWTVLEVEGNARLSTTLGEIDDTYQGIISAYGADDAKDSGDGEPEDDTDE